MIFAQFYKMSTGYVEGSCPPEFREDNKKLIPDVGSESILILDGRKKLSSLIIDANDICKKRGGLGFTLHKGDFRKDVRIVPGIIKVY